MKEKSHESIQEENVLNTARISVLASINATLAKAASISRMLADSSRKSVVDHFNSCFLEVCGYVPCTLSTHR